MAEAAAAAVLAKSAAIFVGKTAAGAAISYFVNKALGRLSEEDEDLRQNLTAKLPIIEAVFAVGNQSQVWENQAVSQWLWQFRDATQEAEDALDELEFLDLKKKAKDQRPKDWKVSLFPSLPNIRRSLSLSAVATGGSSKRLKDAMKGLDSVLDEAGNFLSVIKNIPSSTYVNQDLGNTRETTRELTTTVFGRKKERDEIVDWLGVHSPLDSVDHKLSVCAIVGDGGMGKTTLAQFICKDKIVQDHFGVMILWVHVSKRFDPKVLLSRILESIKPDKINAEALDTLQLDLNKQLAMRRFLLVLDDAWEDMEDERWEQFLGSIKNNAVMGGRILLTTRMRSVADAVKRQLPVGYKSVELTGLNLEDTLMLFNHHAFGDSIPNSHLQLQLISEHIAMKLQGCPFLAKVLGQQVRDNPDLSRWNTILNQDIHQSDEIAPIIKDMLTLSYQNLTYEVQLCFRYCSIFPPDYKFKMEEVTEMWVSSGLILPRQNGKSQEDIAEEHFRILARRSFFSLVPRELNVDPSEDYYAMHGLMYAFACSVSYEECSRHKASDHNTRIPLKVRHLCIEGVNSETVQIISQSKYLRTLIIGNEENSIPQKLLDDLMKAIKERTCLRLLRLYGTGWFGMNSVIAELKHLRYISMSAADGSNLHKLFELYHLVVIQILKIQKEEKLSFIDTSNLPNLKKLYLPKTTLSRISHIGRLTTLRELNEFTVKNKDGHKISELRNLSMLRKISILDVQNVTHHIEASAAALNKKENMKVLSLGWAADQAIIGDQIFNKLVPYSNLMHLTISGYNGIKPPRWMEIQYLSNLVYLKLDGCLEWDKLPPLGILWTVKHVFLEHLQRLKYIASPDGLPPRLVTLVIRDCPDLSELPNLPFSLQHLGINAVGISSLPTMCDHKRLRDVSILEPQLSILNVESCDFLNTLNGCFLQHEHYKALTALKLSHCHELTSLPDAADFQRISELKSVEIIECNKLSSLGGLLALSCLQVLKIKHCDNLITASSARIPPASVENSSLMLETLAIDDHQLLVSSSLKNLCLTKRLIISGRSETVLLSEWLLNEEWLLQNRFHLEHIEISNAKLLQCLPLNMHDLQALRSLVLHNAPPTSVIPTHASKAVRPHCQWLLLSVKRAMPGWLLRVGKYMPYPES